MKQQAVLSRKWLYIFVAVALAAAAVFVWACVKQDATVMVATGLVVGVQIVNIVQWIRSHRTGR
ncbi:hypothetical protein [Parabacteroides sp. An277]|uniref:hypothetical protein n=1 Tax=Parabacteroides sp. An277 TaxID=1965619 RepID=UPI00111F078F|nr:hypothetical protein [Parabacteroides sp. An277]